MRILLDTHIFLWFISADARLSESMRMGIQEPENQVFLSSVSVWEVIVKHQLGKLPCLHLRRPTSRTAGEAPDREPSPRRGECGAARPPSRHPSRSFRSDAGLPGHAAQSCPPPPRTAASAATPSLSMAPPGACRAEVPVWKLIPVRDAALEELVARDAPALAGPPPLALARGLAPDEMPATRGPPAPRRIKLATVPDPDDLPTLPPSLGAFAGRLGGLLRGSGPPSSSLAPPSPRWCSTSISRPRAASPSGR